MCGRLRTTIILPLGVGNPQPDHSYALRGKRIGYLLTTCFFRCLRCCVWVVELLRSRGLVLNGGPDPRYALRVERICDMRTTVLLQPELSEGHQGHTEASEATKATRGSKESRITYKTKDSPSPPEPTGGHQGFEKGTPCAFRLPAKPGLIT